MKNNKFFIPGMLALALVFGLVLTGCGDPGGEDTGTFRIKVIEIPPDVMTAGMSRKIQIGMALPNTLKPDPKNSGAIAGRILEIESYDDDFGTDWYEFYMYDVEDPYESYVGSAGNYDIGFMIYSNLPVVKVIKNRRLEVNKTNTISYSLFTDF
ncbi:MAG: hypothetical protein LBT95_06310 [Treponema sp.]|jgi:hypothetical protein|nr:hypothetical protein [Treponema sp.]